MKLSLLSLTLLLAIFCPQNDSTIIADEGEPVAVRLWPNGGVTIETMWDLHIGGGLTEATLKQLPHPLDLDLATVATPGSAMTLGRLANEPKSSMTSGDQTDPADKHGAIVSCVDMNQLAGSIQIQVDGISIHILNGDIAKAMEKSPKLDHKAFAEKSEQGLNTIVVLDQSFDEAKTLEIAKAMQPGIVVVPAALTKVGDQDVTAHTHNTLAVSATKNKKDAAARFVSLSDEPYKLSDQLSELFEKKEAACKNSRATFAKLSVDQLNFRPSNGTHTPRWNTEHMMGRELLFFSQIYHFVDSSVPVMDLNPGQMPDKYKMAHPDWTGEEEARQTKRVEAFTRRFAYLLDGMELNKKAKGSKFWTPRALLKQMERHYNQHTGNVRKKMKADEWPK